MNDEQKLWEKEFLEKIYIKRKKNIETIKSLYPYTTKDGRYDNFNPGRFGWTCGFWGGIQWLLYEYGKEACFFEKAKTCTDDVIKALSEFLPLCHDLGFQFFPTAVKGYRLTGDERCRTVALHAATLLAGRFNPVGKFIRAWDVENNAYRGNTAGLAIIDCMMNLSLLYWAGREIGDPRFAHIANAHADTTMRTFVRDDGSVNHIVIYNTNNGEIIDKPRGQGYAEGSSWTRGQAWAIYGFTETYENTGKKEYLDTALKVCKYFIDAMGNKNVPPIDFKQPCDVDYIDTTAGVIAASGMMMLKKHVSKEDAEIIEEVVVRLLKGAYENCSFDLDEDSILQNGSELYHREDARHLPIIYGDYYLIETLLLRGREAGDI